MKILHVIDSDGIYGAEVMLLNLMKEQQAMGLEPLLMSIEDPAKTKEYSLAEEAIKIGLKAIRLYLDRRFSFSNSNTILRIAAKREIDIIHSHGYKGNILLGSLSRYKREIPVISTIHGWTAVKKFSKIWFYSILDRFFLKRLDAIVYVNKQMLNVIRHKNAYVVENGIPEQEFDSSSLETYDPEIYSFCKEGFVIGCISRLSEEKGLLYLLEAMQVLSRMNVDFKAIIIGEGPQKTLLQETLKKLNLSNRVIITGYRSKAYNYLPLFNVFVLPSLTEGLPITILEAMQARVPIVATNVGGIPDVLENGKGGVIIESGNSGVLTDAILYVKTNSIIAAKMTKRAQENVLNNYSSKGMAENYLKSYKSVLD